MEPMLFTTGIVGVIGTDIVKNVLGTAITGIQHTLHFIQKGSNENELFLTIHNKLKLYDLEMQFKIAEKYIEICHNEILTKYIINSINSINNLIEIIRLKMSKHTEKWFHGYRSCDVDKDILSLDTEVKLFEKRLDIISKYVYLSSK